ncbi:MAG: enoyl-CoA hydratase/isomerase family protein [Gemmatimonadota bacterium]|nr:MAG: enoyl-CoA hydratase/isomerase family protein [Gemmatimonadota bacterium]
MSYNDISVGVDRKIGTITLNRPDKLNSFANQMRVEIAAAVNELSGRDDVAVMVITGAGRGFCTGADVTYLKEIVDRRDEDALRGLVEAGRTVVTSIRRAPKPVIASVNGPAAGGGANLALACDIRIASERASIGQTFNRIGLHPDWGGTYFLPRLVGPAIAAELIFTGAMIPAQEAHRLGIFNRVVPHDQLTDETQELAAALASKPRLSLALAKQAIYRSLGASLEEMLDFELDAQLRCGFSADGREGMTAFVERREPRFGSRE